MSKAIRLPLRSYLIAVLTVVAALLLTRLFEPLHEQTPLALFFAAVAVSAWYGGLWPGLLATAVTAFTLIVFVLPSPYSLIVDSWDKTIALGTFALLAVAVLMSLLHAARRRAEKSQGEQREWLEVTLASIGDGVIATDAQGRVTFMNPVAESLTGWPSLDAVGKDLPEVFRIIDMNTHQVVENPLSKVIRLGSIVGLANHTLLIARDGTEKPIDDSGAPIRAHDGQLVGIVLVFRDVAERTAELQTLNAQLQASLGEKEVLLKEIHHRVKNNMQVISSLPSLQADSIDEPHLLAIFKDSQQRIQSMALVHDILYRSNNLGRGDLSLYTRRLIAELRQSYSINPEQIHLQLDLDEVFVSMDITIPCGLLLHELVSNCFKHAFAPGEEGEIHVELKSQTAGRLILVVSDNGRGFPEDVDFRQTDSLGLQLIGSLTEQLEGHIELEGRHGARFTVTFPI